MDNAFERARAAYGTGAYDDATLEFIFPELKESRDEQIRKAIIKSLDMPFPEDNLPGTDVTYKEAVAWLEKQKDHFRIVTKMVEQKPEWSEEDELMRTTVIQTLERFGGCGTTGMQIDWLKSLRPQPKEEWSEDWREEDIQTRFAFYTYKDDLGVLYLSNVFVEEASRNHGFGTKILIAAEKVAETIGATTISLKVKQNSPANAWYRKNGYGYVAFEDGYDWLEKNLEYMKPNKQEWSEEDKCHLASIIGCIELCKEDTEDAASVLGYYDSDIAWLKSLRPQPKQELSIEKAIQWLDDTFYFLDNSSGRGRDCEITTHDFDSLEEMYASFRKAVSVDKQPHWKPSEE